MRVLVFLVMMGALCVHGTSLAPREMQSLLQISAQVPMPGEIVEGNQFKGELSLEDGQYVWKCFKEPWSLASFQGDVTDVFIYKGTKDEMDVWAADKELERDAITQSQASGEGGSCFWAWNNNAIYNEDISYTFKLGGSLEQETSIGNGGEFQPPPAGSCRSACPVLNALANHGFFDRTGMKLTAQDLAQAFKVKLGLTDFFANQFAGVAGAKFAKLACLDEKRKEGKNPLDELVIAECGGAKSFSLCTTWIRFDNQPEGGIFHNASMMMPDQMGATTEGREATMNPPNHEYIESAITAVQEEDIECKKELTMSCMVKMRGWIWEKSLQAYPEMSGVTKQKLIAAAESVFAIKILGGKNGLENKVISWDHFRSFLKENKFPDDFEKAEDVGITNIVGGVGEFFGKSSWMSFIEKVDATMQNIFGKVHGG